MHKAVIFIVLITYFFVFTGRTQEPYYFAGFEAFFDNHEYVNDYTHPQTMYGSRMSLGGGLKFLDQQRIAGGVNVLYEFGSDEIKSPDLILYYQYNNSWLDFSIGSQPRHGIIDFPFVLISDTIKYYRPNLEGIYVNFKRNWGNHSFWLDWTSRQTNTKRETFIIGGEANARVGLLLYQHNWTIYHYARPAIPLPDDHLRDNAGIVATLGTDFSKIKVLDSLVIRCGVMASADRLRNVYDFKYPVGFIARANIKYNIIGIRGLYYIGDKQDLMLGDGFYKSGNYARIDGCFTPFKSLAVDAEVKFSLHLLKGVVDMSQTLTLYVYFDRLGMKDKNHANVQ